MAGPSSSSSGAGSKPGGLAKKVKAALRAAARDLKLAPPDQKGGEDQKKATKPPPKCVLCGVTKTPLWRRGPTGFRTLCNACGLRYWKEEKMLSTKLAVGSGSKSKK